MRSGSSELLLDQQQQELRIRKIKELAPNKKKNAVKRKLSWRERANFYSTSTLAFFSVTAGASLLFLVPLYVDPAISTLVSDFIDQPTMCTTSRREDLTGIFNCSWSSCREGCTSDMYRCTHIYVTFIDSTNISLPSTLLSSSPTNNLTTVIQQFANNFTDLQQPQSEEAILLVNIKGCGYPPNVKCKNFTDIYGIEGVMFPCYFSKQNKTVVMTNYNRDDQVSMIINFFVVPFVITVLSSIGLCIMHCDCRCKKERQHRRKGQLRRPKLENLSDSSISTRVDMLTPAIEVYKQPL